jgi:hypothetical protein
MMLDELKGHTFGPNDGDGPVAEMPWRWALVELRPDATFITFPVSFPVFAPSAATSGEFNAVTLERGRVADPASGRRVDGLRFASKADLDLFQEWRAAWETIGEPR